MIDSTTFRQLYNFACIPIVFDTSIYQFMINIHSCSWLIQIVCKYLKYFARINFYVQLFLCNSKKQMVAVC